MATLIIKEAVQVLPMSHGGRALKLAEYIDNPAKCAAAQCANLPDSGPDAKTEDAAREMAALCYAADHAQRGQRKLIQHWILSWKLEDGEQTPSNQKMFDAAGEAMEAIGFGACPRIMATHTNTAHPHVHIAVARVDPAEGKIVRDAHTHIKAQKAVAEITARHGWATERGHWYRYRDGQIVKATKEERTKRGGIRTRTIADEMQRVRGYSAERDLAQCLADFCAANRQHFAAWKWGDLHRALALQGIEMQYTDHGQGRGGLAFSADGKTWKKASQVCPELVYGEISRALGASGSYRKARKEIAKLVADARAARSAATPPTSSTPKDAPEQETQSPAENLTPIGARSAEKPEPQKEERKPMTEQEYARINYMAFSAMQHADENTKAVINALNKDKLYGKEENKEFLTQQEKNLKQIAESKYTDTESYSRMRFDAARYHAKLVYGAIRRERRSAEDRMKFREFFLGHLVAAKKYTDDAMMQLRIIVQQMRMRGNSQRQIARAMQDADDDGMSDAMKAIIEFSEYASAALADVFALPSKIRDAETPLDKRIHEINKKYDMCIVPKEYKDEIAAERQAAIYAAQTIDRWNRRRNSRRTGEERTEVARKYDTQIDKLLNAILSNPKCNKKQLYANIKEEIERITDNIAAGKNSKNKDDYETLRQKLAEYKTAQAVETDMQPATAMDGTIGKRHYSEAEKLAEAQGTGSIGARKIMALRMRATDKKEADAVRIMVAAGMDPGDAARAVAYVYNTQAGDAALERAAKHAARWKQEETGRQAAARPQGQAAARPAPRPARPKM